MTTEKGKFYRILDANLNRAKEGLRVCEDLARFALDDRPLTLSIKHARHQLTRAGSLMVPAQVGARYRAIEQDVGKATIRAEVRRRHLADLVFANLQRVKEALRVLEEISKVLDSRGGDRFKRLRYQVYAIESQIAKRLAAVRRP